MLDRVSLRSLFELRILLPLGRGVCQTALGQFISHRAALQQQEADRILYLAIPNDVYDTFFTMRFIQSLVQQNQIYLIVYDIEQEAIAQWLM
ncbi:MAG: fdxN element excision controlling factor protein [Coleofasciculaceae cyanobacterium SM2_1_6]|nr:fdxN element excision controlling factor protein [Coleofasciculaceae cyanobacterium SM2_1_6]